MCMCVCMCMDFACVCSGCEVHKKCYSVECSIHTQHIHTCTRMHTHTYLCMCVCVCMCLLVHVCMYVCSGCEVYQGKEWDGASEQLI